MKKALFLLALFFPLLFSSCNKIIGGGQVSEEWFLDNGWVEVIMEYGNPIEHFMQVDASGNIMGVDYSGGYYYEHSERWWDFRLYSSFDQLNDLTSAPSDGYVGSFYVIIQEMLSQENTLIHGRMVLINIWIMAHTIHIIKSTLKGLIHHNIKCISKNGMMRK